LNMYSIIGSRGHATSVIAALRSLHPEAKNTVRVYDPYEDSPCPVRATSSILGRGKIAESDPPYFIAIGSNQERYDLWDKLGIPTEKYGSIIHPGAYLDPDAHVGTGVFIGFGAYVGPNVTIGDFSIINTNAVVEHDSAIGNFVHLAPGACICGQVRIGDLCMVGANATVLPALTVPERTTLGAGAVVVRSPAHPGGLYTGIPAQKK
jgi:acetyltransferase EpsM